MGALPREIKIRHSKSTASRLAHEAAAALVRFAGSSPAPFIDGIRASHENRRADRRGSSGLPSQARVLEGGIGAHRRDGVGRVRSPARKRLRLRAVYHCSSSVEAAARASLNAYRAKESPASQPIR